MRLVGEILADSSYAAVLGLEGRGTAKQDGD
jgi:hypothetical protein